MPAVSVIIPVYNKEKHIRECLDSVCNQTLSDIEIICIDDCSKDNSLDVLKEYSSKDTRIKVIKLLENIGAAAARNVGLDIANGEYLSFIDADDYIDADYYEKLYTSANGSDIVKGSIIIDDASVLSKPCWQISSSEFLAVPYKFIYGFTSAIYRNNFIKQNNIRFPEGVRNLEDPYFLIWAVALCRQFSANDTATYYYQQHKGSASASSSINDIMKGAEKIFALINSLKLSKEHYLYVFDFIYNVVSTFPSRNDESKAFLKKMLDATSYKKDIMLLQVQKIRQVLPIQNKTTPTQKVSVIVPVYNVEKYLSRCLDSIINQTYTNLEIICVNDCSPDKSSQILQEYAKKDNRIKIVNRDKNGGLSAARNSGMDIATGKYVYFLDSDDWIDNDYIEKILEKTLQTDCDIVLNTNIVAEHETYSEHFSWQRYPQKLPDGEFLDNVTAVNNTQCMIWAHLYKKDFLTKHNLRFPEGLIHEDVYFQYVSKINTDKIFAFYGPSYHYLQRSDSIMATKNNKIYNLIDIFNLSLEFYKKNNLLNKYPNVQIFRLDDFSCVNNETHFGLLQKYLKCISDDFENHPGASADIDKFMFKVISESENYKAYKKKLLNDSWLLTYIIRKHQQKNNNPKISVIVPVYNAEKYISKCLDSLINQTLKNIEIICIDDFSTDNSLQIIRQYATKDRRIKIIKNPHNMGEGATRNAGITKATGEYLGFVDSDDAVDLNFYEKLYNIAKPQNLDIAKGNMLEIDYQGRKKITNKNHLESSNPLYINDEFTTLIYKLSFLKKHNILFPCGVPLGPDILFLNNVVLLANSVAYVNDVHYLYFRREDSMNSAILSTEKALSGLKVYEMIINNTNTSPGAQKDKNAYMVATCNLFLNCMTMTFKTAGDIKEKCAQFWIYLYDKILFKDVIDSKLSSQFPKVLEFIKNKDAKGLYQYISSYSNWSEFIFASLKDKLRKS